MRQEADYRAENNARGWPDPTPEELASPRFEAIWQCIKKWDINVPEQDDGYSSATGNHVIAIMNAIAADDAYRACEDAVTELVSWNEVIKVILDGISSISGESVEAFPAARSAGNALKAAGFTITRDKE